MKRIDRNEVLGIGEYEEIRAKFRARVIEEKKRRRVALGPRATALFENRDTVLLQIEEMLRTERITREGAIAHEIETYNAFIPGERGLSCTVMIEIDDHDEREKFLTSALGLEAAFSIVVDGESFAGLTTPERVLTDRASAVIYLQFVLSERAVTAIQATVSGEPHAVELRVDHKDYRASATLPRELLVSLAQDFE